MAIPSGKLTEAVLVYCDQNNLTSGKAMVSDDAIVLWTKKNFDGTPHPEPDLTTLEVIWNDIQARKAVVDAAYSNSSQRIIDNKVRIKSMANSLQAARDFVTAQGTAEALAICLFLVCNVLVRLARLTKKVEEDSTLEDNLV